MAKSKKTANQEKPKLKDVLGAFYGLGGEEQAKAAAQMIPAYEEEIRAGMKKAKKIVYAGEVHDISNEPLAKAVAEIIKLNPHSESTKDMLAVLAMGETFGYKTMEFGSYSEGVTLKKEELSKKILGEATGMIKKFEEGLELPDGMTPEERDALMAAKNYGFKAAWAGVSKGIGGHSSYADMTRVYAHAVTAPINIAQSGASVMGSYLKSLNEERAAAAKKKAGIPTAAEK